MTKIIYLEHY